MAVRRNVWVLIALLMLFGIQQVSALSVVGTRKWMFAAILDPGGTSVVQYADKNYVLVQMDAPIIAASVTASNGFSLGTTFSVDNTAIELSDNEFYLILDFVNPNDINSGAVGSVDVEVSVIAGNQTFALDVALRALRQAAYTVFDGYSDIEPTSMNFTPPAGWGTRYSWSGDSISGGPLGATIDFETDEPVTETRMKVFVSGGIWLAQDASFELSIASASAAWENAVTFTVPLSFRSIAPLFAVRHQVPGSGISPLSGAAAGGGQFDISDDSPVFTLTPAGLINTLEDGFATWPSDEVVAITIDDGDMRPAVTLDVDMAYRVVDVEPASSGALPLMLPLSNFNFELGGAQNDWAWSRFSEDLTQTELGVPEVPCAAPTNDDCHIGTTVPVTVGNPLVSEAGTVSMRLTRSDGRWADVEIAVVNADAVAVDPAMLPASFSLHAPAPNPTPGQVWIAYEVPRRGGPVRVTIFDVAGRHVRALVNGEASEGHFVVPWDGRDHRLRKVPAGIYFVAMQSPAGSMTRRLIVLR